MENPKNKPKGDACLDEMLIARYVLHQCSQEERQEVESHLITCPPCLKEIAILTKMESESEDEEELEDLPDWIYTTGMEMVRQAKKAKGEVEAKKLIEINKPVLEILLQFIRGHWMIIGHNMAFSPLFVLSSPEPGKRAALPSLFKELREYRVEIDLHESEGETIDLHVKVQQIPDKKIALQVRFILKDEENKKVISDTIHDGDLPFSRLTPGKYSLELIHQEKNISIIALNLKKG